MYDGAQFSTSKLVSWLFPDPRSAGLFETPEPMRLTQRDKLVAVILAVLFFGMHVYLFWGEWAVDASAYYFAIARNLVAAGNYVAILDPVNGKADLRDNVVWRPFKPAIENQLAVITAKGRPHGKAAVDLQSQIRSALQEFSF